MAKFSIGISDLIILMMIYCSIGGVPAATYTVGDSSGWSMNGGYESWATDKKFQVGDTLVFNYVPGHTVDEVSANDYKACTSGNSITTDSSGATSITLKTAGPHYFICGVTGHCSGGMKLAVTVAASASGNSPSTTTSPPSSTDTTTSPPSSTTITPPSTTGDKTPATGTPTQPSSSATVSPAVALLFSVCIVMFKYFL